MAQFHDPNGHERELQAIHRFYGDRVAERSQVPLINHITEGLTILTRLDASPTAKRAWCLHPLFQDDEQLLVVDPAPFDPYDVMVVMEYRSKANAWLSDKVVADGRRIGAPDTGPLPEVRLMLIADKVQNFKDFQIHHLGTHERSAELNYYFRTWLLVLGIDDAQYERLVLDL